MTKYILPIFIIAILIVALIRKVDIYSSFVKGVKSSLDIVISIFPYVVSIMIIIHIFEISGLNSQFERFFAPIFKMLNIPKELTSLIVIRPLSGSGSIGILDSLMSKYGVDSHIAKCGAIICGASETIFYVTSVYFSKTKVKKYRYALPVALISSFIGILISCFLAKYI